ncbi:hypothetical protein BgiBS90_032380 [Biomphalaria glabrata]|nr:hypothetical protein BgiBS90_032380 [Biomphalaria glabrata]
MLGYHFALIKTKIVQNNFSGGHECQISEGGTEADLHKHLKDCQKNPGHRQFIPIKSFNIQHLPEDHRDTDLYDLINAVAELTVRVSVVMISPNRPEFFLNTNSPYPFYGMGGNANTRSGSGVITIYKYECGCGHNVQGKRQNPVTERIYEREYKSCPCEQCQHSDKPSNVWWEIYVGTAAHVVFDDIEARHTTCRLFYDERTSPLVRLDKFTLDYVDVERDRCRLMSVVCDSSLGDRLFQTAVHRDTLRQKLDAKYKNRDNGTFSFIVSHPHGCPKQVSIGQYKENYIVGDYNKEYKFTKLSYTTSTCPGSSGASVCCLGLNNLHVHGGSLDKALNHSTIDWSTVSEQCS